MSWIWSKKKTHKPLPVSATKVTYVDKATQTEGHHPEGPQAYYPARQSTTTQKKVEHQSPGRQDEGLSRLNSVRIPTGASAEIEEQLKSSVHEHRTRPTERSISSWLDGIGEVLLPAKPPPFRRLPIPIIFEKEEVNISSLERLHLS
jgi:hypothetical protein